jgi:hypothetical protein
MIRQNLQAGSTHVFMCRTPQNGMAFQYRAFTNGSSNNINTGGTTPIPRWVLLRRSGVDFSGYWADDNAGQPGTWQLLGGTPLLVSDPLQIGLAVTSHVSGTLSEAVFDNVRTTGTLKPGAGIIIGDVRPPPGPRLPSHLARLLPSLCGHFRPAVDDRLRLRAAMARRQIVRFN